LIHASLQDYDVRKQPPVAVNRTTQVFVNLNNSNWRLDKNIFVPFGLVIGEDGMKTFDNLFSGYGQEPDQVHNVPMQCMTGQWTRRRISFIHAGLPISHPIFLCCPTQTLVRK
jgi:hypothetical protein